MYISVECNECVCTRTVASQRVRTLESVCADNFVVPTSIAPVAVGVIMAEAYHKEAITNSSEKDRGAPGPQVL